MRALSNLILRVRTAADRHSWRRSGRSSSGNYQRKQSADGTARLKKRSRWKQSWTWEGPFGTNEFSAGIALRHGQSRYTRYQIQSDILHSSIFDSASQHQPRTRRNVSTFPHSINDLKVSKNHKKAGEVRRPLVSQVRWLTRLLRPYVVAKEHPNCESPQPDCH